MGSKVGLSGLVQPILNSIWFFLAILIQSDFTKNACDLKSTS